MVFKEILQRLSEKRNERRDMIKRIDNQLRIEKIVQERQMSNNERELRRFEHEEREENIKKELADFRKQREREISFDHNPLDEPMILKSKWNILKERNMFANNDNNILNQRNIFVNNENIFRRKK